MVKNVRYRAEVAELGYCRCAARPFHPDDQITNKDPGPAFFCFFFSCLVRDRNGWARLFAFLCPS